ncbi:hypothetical protein [Dolichospermum circinale]|uniref:hypothetical protein n=1 Tax=Dolichospermum circinale TaxID=109265 RepID=UPI00232F16AA|nr:hypothetical protein [Dolichospermum circinale]MDB9466585.1 hypothetical protein [Dolichospermum circinale CS-539/09]MDB9472002.1 hypothetical protein [Dolichospermum circinale CS-539]
MKAATADFGVLFWFTIMVKQPGSKKPVTDSIPAKVPAKMTIKLVSKNDKFRSIIIDAFRILSWEQFRSEYKVTGLDGYAKFYELWSVHEIHSMSFRELQSLYSSLDYSMSDLAKIRNDYYAKRRKANDQGSQEIEREDEDFSDDPIPY